MRRDGFGEIAVAVRHAMDREFLRLEKVAQSAAAHIHKLASGSCVSCGGALFLSPLANVPARFCSAGCAAGSSQDSGAATSPKE
ncbi:hypothetical protein AR457_35885 [Streptomyces agglomeratus]|uniref:Uncharacterized protein n=1 Tax=Streptomyces agglomeratus TaxID=285458 RepID=A0A1E5NY58_9ACTN|nr:hypothetical protein AS594_37080 [Streptomyces agglomeratus]OEJ22682.1 hypothetical protein AR457_35885 [Streptomyces agglomeratus]OEJ36632.1 hypothetical protein BGK72_36270 [Streptomyces agglomeratus]OEJ56351.1 hypothetical protein BGM19_37155 [Streptomyces agglomeratus]